MMKTMILIKDSFSLQGKFFIRAANWLISWTVEQFS